MKKHSKWIISTLCILVFLIIGLYFIQLEDNTIDKVIYNLIISIKSKTTTTFFKIITSFASVKFMIIISIVVLLLKKLKHIRYFIILNIVNDAILNTILKFIFKRERPFDLMLVEESGYSFPSGHTMMATVFYGFIIYLINKSKYKKRTKIILNTLLTMLILLIGISRIYLGVHYATDVIAGFLIGISYLIIFTHIIDKYLIKKDKY